jgi:hypothetical protein
MIKFKQDSADGAIEVVAQRPVVCEPVPWVVDFGQFFEQVGCIGVK